MLIPLLQRARASITGLTEWAWLPDWQVSRGSQASYLDRFLERRGSAATLTARVGADGRLWWLTVRVYINRLPRWGLTVAEWVARAVLWMLG